jgi:ABC-2 type transport system ATP-binding protein
MQEIAHSQTNHEQSHALYTISQTKAIEIIGLNKIYRGTKGASISAVKDLNLNVTTGQIFGFLGANGAGKTTTIKMLCGLITPTSGHMSINGYDVTHQRGLAMRQIGAVLEGTRNVYWRLSPWQNLLYFGRIKGCHGKALQERAERLLRELDLWERREDAVRTFSRGMQQKVAIACALIADPPIILLDEPTLGLDLQAARVVKEWVLKLAREQGKTIVLTTHQLDIAQELCDQVAIMRKGQLLTNRPLNELLHLFHVERYQIRVKGLLNDAHYRLFSTMEIAHENGESILSGTINNQQELYSLLDQVRATGLPLLSVARSEPNLEEVFLSLIEKGDKA